MGLQCLAHKPYYLELLQILHPHYLKVDFPPPTFKTKQYSCLKHSGGKTSSRNQFGSILSKQGNEVNDGYGFSISCFDFNGC